MRNLLSPRKTSTAAPSLSSSSSAKHTDNVPSINVHEPPADSQQQQQQQRGGMSSAFVSKSRKVRFDLHLSIIDLNNVPLVSGTSFIKWHLPSSTAAEHRGRTNKCVIRDHRVAYEYDKRLPVRLTIGKDGMLQECPVEFEVLQEYSASGRGERIELGNVRLNLAEYVDAADPTSPGAGPRDGESTEEGGIVRRYLMQDSKINSTLKLGIHMRYAEGSRDYFAPPLRTAPVFGGIAGIISSSEPAAPTTGNAGNGEDAAAGQEALPNLSTRNKEIGEMQDMYRRTLAAFWASQPGELKADECIEDIFAGGDGWGTSKSHREAHGGGGAGSQNQHHGAGNNNNHNNRNERDSLDYPSSAAPIEHNASRKHFRDRANSHPTSGTNTPRDRDLDGVDVTGRGEGRVHAQGKGMLMMGRKGRHSKNFAGARRAQGEVDEFEVREDLRSWGVGERAFA